MRRFLFLLVLLLFCSSCSGILQEYHEHELVANQFYETYDEDWVAQTFTVTREHSATSVKVWLNRYGDPGIGTISIKATVDNEPNGDDLCSGQVVCITLPDAMIDDSNVYFTEITFTSPATLSAEDLYAIVFRTSTGDAYNTLNVHIDPEGLYEGGGFYYSGNSGENWYLQVSADLIFEEYGTTITENAVRNRYANGYRNPYRSRYASQ